MCRLKAVSVPAMWLLYSCFLLICHHVALPFLLGDYAGDGARELFRRLGSINRALERIGFRVEESNALGMVSRELPFRPLFAHSQQQDPIVQL